MSIFIAHNDDIIKINNLGFITSWSFNPLVSESFPIYLVVFEEYSRLNPFCQPLDMSERIEIKFQDKSKLSYTKKIGRFIFDIDISITSEGVDWNFIFDYMCTNYSVGFAMPYSENWCDFSKQAIKEDIANYSSFLHKGLYFDQHVLDMPCIFSDATMVFGSMKNDYQFFRYRDNDSHWLRVTTSTSTPTESVDFCIRTNAVDAQKLYLQKFPEADEFIHKWKALFEELGKRFKLSITCQQSETVFNKGGSTYISKSYPTNKDLEKFYPVLKIELEKYPESFFADLDITSIQLVVDLWIQTEDSKHQSAGRLWADEQKGLIIDIQFPVRIIHHEIFHGIQQKKKFYNMPGEISQFSDSIRIDGISEYLAELFSLLMTNPGKAYSPALGISLEQINYLKDGVKEFVTFPDDLSQKSEQRTVFALTPFGIQEIEFGDICETATRYSSFKDKL